ncbi:Thioredoxin [Mucilaginibacter mallensis]|uniref:Thioredoxin n=1 Tax=Mucilaginibacter mallensis TaxID=652787 RepID=A0A1H2ACA2_MUCMA|nr:vitamin K epoxide reductase family protein [Mucilaginibacter mallensis]SDT43497.1 Thioredoxin [Mucilaginibacter mallensis]
MKKDNIISVLHLLIKELHIPVTSQSVEDELQKHPEFNSLLGISDVLNNWNVPNVAYALSFDELSDADITDPFIAYLSEKQFALVHSLDSKKAIVSDETWSRYVLPIDEFKRKYAGTILVAEKDHDSGERNYVANRQKEIAAKLRIPFVITSCIIFTFFFILHKSDRYDFNGDVIFLNAIKLLGLTTTILLLIQSVDATNPLIQKLCGGDDNENCNAILSSKSAKITDQLNWSELGFFYFSGTWLALFFIGDNSVMRVLAILNLMCLPYTFYSIYYQWRIAKQWCKFCCVVQGLLWLEFGGFLPFLMNTIKLPSLAEWANLIITMMIPIILWIFVKPYIVLSGQVQPLILQLRNFKYSSDLFNKMLHSGAKYSLPKEEYSLIIGNRQAEHTITMVSNPYCQPCSKAHTAMEWIHSRNDVKLQVVFVVNKDDDDKKVGVVTRLMSLQSEQNDLSLKFALDDWYENKNYESWTKRHPVKNLASYSEALQKQSEWCSIAEVAATPTIFINGRKLPANYQPEDIKYLI